MAVSWSRHENHSVRPPTDTTTAEATAVRVGARARIRATPGLCHLYRLGVFLAGALFVVLGVALAVLPGPLTIPPVLLGLWIWSTEFRWARRLFVSMRGRAGGAWQHARAHLLRSMALTVGGVAAICAAIWTMRHFQLLATIRQALLP